MKIASGTEGRRARVEIVPLLDVLLIILIFLLYLALTSPPERGIEVALPSGSGHAVKPAATIVVTKEGRVLLDDRQIELGAVVAQTRALLRSRAETGGTILLRSDRASQLGITVDILSRLEQAGLDHVSLEVRGGSGGS